MLHDANTFFRIVGSDLSVYTLKSTQDASDDFFHQENLYHEVSFNHFGPVSAVSSYGDYIVSTSSVGKYNFKLWKVSRGILSIAD